ncbi:MAG: hypothetical protein FWH21_09985 [Kiritimatiellaeota bacterium]|nr:hypothetical protein [Kiritimatiellota bacterium]
MENATTFWAVVSAAAVAAFVHTLIGPDHYLPFIALAKCRNWRMGKTLLWTFVCGIGHIVSALLIAVVFYAFGKWLTKAHFELLETYRGDLAAWLLMVLGAAYLIWGLHAAFRARPHTHTHQHEDGEVHTHQHRHTCTRHRHWHERPDTAKALPWILFIIFAFGPCEALWPLLTGAAIVGTTCLIVSTLVFSAVTILTMLVTVGLTLRGIRLLKFTFLERYAHAIAGLTILLCGIAIAFLGL